MIMEVSTNQLADVCSALDNIGGRKCDLSQPQLARLPARYYALNMAAAASAGTNAST